MIQLFALHTAYGLMTAVSAIDEGLVEPADERILVPINSAAVPEIHRGLDEAPHLRPLLSRFDRIEPLTALLSPLHPTGWSPREQELPLLERLFRRAWGLGEEPLHVFVQTPQVAPTRIFLSMFSRATLSIIGDGLMTYSPIRSRMPRSVVERVESVVYADVVPGIEPLLFDQAARIPVPAAAFARAIAEVDEATTDAELQLLARDPASTALVLGQYLTALEIVSAGEELAMQEEMIDRACDWGVERVVFKPHPSAPPALTDAVRARALQRGVAFTTYGGDVPAEVVAVRLSAVGVAAGFSTALPTVQALAGTPIAAVGNDVVLERLAPFENGNRIPATIVDALTRPGSPFAATGELQLLVDAVGYAMQPRIAEQLRPRAEELLARISPAERTRYFSAARLAQLGLPGATRLGHLTWTLRGTGGYGRADEARLAVRGFRRRCQRAWRAVRGR
nr:polysialyltransferase family glycosyltransferase [Microbacterium bovistercoris]